MISVHTMRLLRHEQVCLWGYVSRDTSFITSIRPESIRKLQVLETVQELIKKKLTCFTVVAVLRLDIPENPSMYQLSSNPGYPYL